MSLFESYLSRGHYLAEGERLAIYKYLLSTKGEQYSRDATELLKNGSVTVNFANGVIRYELVDRRVSYLCKRADSTTYSSEIRTLGISKSRNKERAALAKFFAQAEVDVLRNYPIDDESDPEMISYATNAYPFYDLNYYSNGRGKITGLFKKLTRKDDELLEKLLAS